MKVSYQEYIRSEQWRTVANAVKARDGYRCRVCNSGENLVAHHRTYNNLGNELNNLGDLTCMCHSCHEKFHDPKEVDGRMVATVMPVRARYSPPKKKHKGKHKRRSNANAATVNHDEPSGAFSSPTSELHRRYRITPKNYHLLLAHRDNFETFARVGINFRCMGWMRRAVGKVVPLFCFQKKHRAFVRMEQGVIGVV